MMNWRYTLLFLAVYAFVGSASAYELYTHAAITREAYERTVLADPVVLDDMGLNAISGYLGKDYFDLRNGIPRSMTDNDFEQVIIRDVGADELTLQGWLMRGAIREDDMPLRFGKNPQDLSPPDLPFYRVFNHFYDPVYNRPLTVPPAFQSWLVALNDGAVQTAVDWATGSVSSFGAPNTLNTDRRNHFTLVDAREAMYRAVTGRDVAGNTDIGPNGTPATKEVRDAYWATVFRSLGDVVHLVQDMGQPQHTRNEAHSPADALVQGDHITVFEALTEQRARGESYTCLNSSVPINVTGLAFSDYSVPTFSSYSEAFSTSPGGNVSQGRGLADYRNRGFFTAGKNFGNTEYALPSSNLANYSLQPVTDPNPCQAVGRQAELLRGTVPDLVGSTGTGIALTARGLWDVPGYFIPREETKYSMNETVYYENADLLVTRAASYSAGIINYFFRGKIDFVKDPQNNAQYIIRNLGSEEMEGTFALYYDDVDGIRYPIPSASWQLTLSSGQDSTPVSFMLPINPAPANSDYYLVFNGRMGNESPWAHSVGAVAVKYISEYWESWGETLAENHGWVYATQDEVFSEPPLTPIDGIVTLDTRLAPNRELDVVFALLLLCEDETCATSGDSGTHSRYMRVRLRADSAPFYYSGGCSEGVIGFGNGLISIPIRYAPDVENRFEPIGDSAFIYNNGNFVDYVVPISLGETGGLIFGVVDSDGATGCSDTYFKVDIDYIDFIL